MGEDGLQGEMLTQGETDYYRLRLPQETQRYVFRIVAIKLIIADPARYGFDLGSEDLYPPEVCESVELQCSRSIPVYLIARAAGTYFKNIRNLNPQIMGHYLDAGRYRLCVPQARGFEERFRNLLAEWLAARENSVYVVKKGDNLTLICRTLKRAAQGAADLERHQFQKSHSSGRPADRPARNALRPIKR